ncbi:MAG: alpha/beta hydrolase [Phycisphaerae bacterium]|nr:alpha/beta hydrolase [Phycisphaerae bacterium]
MAYFAFLPMSNHFIRYLFWRVKSSAAVMRGSVQQGDVKIHYVSYGSGPAVVLLHGGLSNRLSWFSQVPWLVASGRQVVLLDTRGHGASDLGETELTYRLLASDVVSVLDRLKIDQADVIGWSDGGNTALMLGLYWSQRIRRLVAISANFSPSGLTPQAKQAASRSSRGLTYWFKRWWTGAGRRLAELETRIQRMWRTRPQLEPDDLTKIGCPVLVIVGEADVVPVSHAERLAESLPQGSMAVLPGGHFTPVTKSREVNTLIAKFLDIVLDD